MEYVIRKVVINFVFNSFTSIKSISFNFIPLTLRTFSIAETGPIPIISGGQPTYE